MTPGDVCAAVHIDIDIPLHANDCRFVGIVALFVLFVFFVLFVWCCCYLCSGWFVA